MTQYSIRPFSSRLFFSQLLIVCTCLSFATVGLAQDSAPAEDVQANRSLKKELRGFDKFLGTWVIDGEWAGGNKLWAKNEYKVGMNGNFVEAKTFAKNEHGKVYQRYLTIWRYNKEKGTVESHGFTYDGSVTVTESEVDISSPAKPIIRSKWKQAEGNYIKQEVQVIDDKSYSWKVWSSSDGEEWSQIMEGVWKKQSQETESAGAKQSK